MTYACLNINSKLFYGKFFNVKDIQSAEKFYSRKTVERICSNLNEKILVKGNYENLGKKIWYIVEVNENNAYPLINALNNFDLYPHMY